MPICILIGIICSLMQLNRSYAVWASLGKEFYSFGSFTSLHALKNPICLAHLAIHAAVLPSSSVNGKRLIVSLLTLFLRDKIWADVFNLDSLPPFRWPFVKMWGDIKKVLWGIL